MKKEIGGELEQILQEATQTVEQELALEDAGWINLSAGTGEIITSQERINNLKLSRLYYYKDPLAKQAIRLWTDYTFGSGLTWQTEDKDVTKVLEVFWNAPTNKSVLSARGQRKSSDKLLVEGEVFFAMFLGTQGLATIRLIDPLEIIDIITDPDDKEDVKFYRRQWSDYQGAPHTSIYRSTSNIKGEPARDNQGILVKHTEEALVYHLTYNTLTQRGNPLLLPALDWIRQYRRFLASRVAIMLAYARFAWRSKVKGGQTAVDTIKAKTHEEEIAAGSHLIENMGVDTTPIKTESGAKNAHDDARMIKLQVCSAVGWPEQYFGDIATGNLATAKTVELPVAKMCESYQAIWTDVYQDINGIVLAHNNIAPDKWYIDIDLPDITPAMAEAIQQVLQVIPDFAFLTDVQQQALLAIGVNNPGEVLKAAKEATHNPDVALLKVVKLLKESIGRNGNKKE
jgi:hypothetical protein